MTTCAIPAQDHHRQELILAARSQVPGDSSVALSWAHLLPWFLDIRDGFHGSRREPDQESMRQTEERCICSRRVTISSSEPPGRYCCILCMDSLYPAPSAIAAQQWTLSDHPREISKCVTVVKFESLPKPSRAATCNPNA